jgi:hypothetical protein
MAATRVLVKHEKDVTDSPAEKSMLNSEKTLLHKERDEFWLLGYRILYPTYPPHNSHRFLHCQEIHAAGKCLFLFTLRCTNSNRRR